MKTPDQLFKEARRLALISIAMSVTAFVLCFASLALAAEKPEGYDEVCIDGECVNNLAPVIVFEKVGDR